MRTLLIESSSGAASGVAESLGAAGHEVVRCHPHAEGAEGGSVLCSGLSEDGCPLDGHGPVDVAISVREPGAGEPRASEAGVTCAIRGGLPVVVVGAGPGHPFEPWTESAASADDALDAVDRAVQRAGERRAEPLQREAERVLEAEGADAGKVQVSVVRDGDAAHVVVRSEREVPETVAGVLATRLHAVDATGSWPTTKLSVSLAPFS